MKNAWPALVLIPLLLAGCESALRVDSLPPEPATAKPAEAAASPDPSRPLAERAPQRREGWSSLVKQARGQLHRGELEQAEDSLTRAYDLTRGHRLGDPRTAASFRNLQRLAAAYFSQGDSTSFGRVMELLWFVSDEVPDARNTEFARLLQELASTRNLQDRPAEARDALLLAFEILQEDPDSSDAARAGVHSQLGLAYLALDDLEAAEIEIGHASEIAAQDGPTGQLYAKSLIAGARLELARGNFDEARQALNSAIEINQDLFGNEHAATARVVRELALLEQAAGRLHAAEMHFDRVVSIWDAAPREHYQQAQSRNELAWFLLETSQDEQAEAHARVALELLEESQTGGQPLASIADTLATALRNQGKYAEAEPLYQVALEQGAEATDLAGWDLGAIAERYASLLEQTNRTTEADELRRRWNPTASDGDEGEQP